MLRKASLAFAATTIVLASASGLDTASAQRMWTPPWYDPVGNVSPRGNSRVQIPERRITRDGRPMRGVRMGGRGMHRRVNGGMGRR
jgi:hypothetical protein